MPEQFTREQILAKPLERSISIETRDLGIDETNRTIDDVSFSSDTPVYHWFGYLILDHSKGCVRLDRINSSGAVLWMHNRAQQIGAASNIRVDQDNKIRSTVKFSRSVLGEEKFQDVQDGILRTTSFGFTLYSLDPEPGKDGKLMMIDDIPVYRSRDWEPFEFSFEPIPADTGTGTDRALDLEKPEETTEILNKTVPGEQRRANSTTTENQVMPNENPNPAQPEITEQTRAANPAVAPVVQNPELVRDAEFLTIGETFGETELARTLALDPAKTPAELRAAILAKRTANQSPIQTDTPENIATRSGQQVQLAHTVYRGGQLKSFKGEKALEQAYRAGQFFMASMFRSEEAIKFCREKGIPLSRTQTGTQNDLGGYFVPVELENTIVDLRILYGIFRSLANISPMTSDTKLINRRVGGLKAYPVGPGQRGTKSKMKWDQIEMIARKWMVLAKYEDEISEDSVISMADTLMSELAYAFTFSEDDAGFNGDGSADYHGIVGIIPKLKGLDAAVANIAGLQEASGNAWSEITEADTLGVVGRLPQFARSSGNVGWFCSHTFNATVLQRIALAKGGVTMAEFNGVMREVYLGKPVYIIEVMPTNEANSQVPLLYGNLAQAATLGDRRGVTVKMTDSNDVDFESDIMTVKGTERFDINVHDVGNADASTANQKAGPVVGLITKSS